MRIGRGPAVQGYKDFLVVLLAMVLLVGLAVLLNHLMEEEMGTPPTSGAGQEEDVVARGREIAARSCAPCHDLSRDRSHDRSGPPLWGIFNQALGKIPGYAYSEAHARKAGECLIWNEFTLDRYLENPALYIPDSKMAFPGLAVREQRRELIQYLKTLRDRERRSILEIAQPREDPFERFIDIRRVDPKLVDVGIREAEKCGACHDLTDSMRNLVGPPLWGVVGRVAGRAEGFCYSEGFLRRTGQKLIWNERTLYHFLKDPRKFIPGTRMLFDGIRKDEHRVGLIGYLRTLK
ncbi:MAG: c-type cytochrome [Magnetococcales bacterium]|nr:c-type cytochrome [Magnetococcales bacterium]